MSKWELDNYKTDRTLIEITVSHDETAKESVKYFLQKVINRLKLEQEIYFDDNDLLALIDQRLKDFESQLKRLDGDS